MNLTLDRSVKLQRKSKIGHTAFCKFLPSVSIAISEFSKFADFENKETSNKVDQMLQ